MRPAAWRRRSRESETGGSIARDRSAGRRLGVRRRAVHQHVDVPTDQPAGGDEHESGDEERCDRVAGRVAGCRGTEAREHRERAREVAAEVDRVRAQGLAAVLASRAKRDDGAGEVDREHDRHDDEQPPRRVDRVARPSREPRDRERRDGDADEREHGRLRQRGEVLGLSVPVLVPFVGGPAGDADREEREQRGNEVGAGMQRLGDESQAAADEAGAELQCGEHRRRADRDERGPALRRHRCDPNQRLPRRACSRSIDSKRALKLPSPKVVAPCRSITSKKSVGRSCAVFVKICSR